MTIERILHRVIDDAAVVGELDGVAPLSPFLASSFDLYQARVLGQDIIVAEDVADTDGAEKRLQALAKAVGEPVAAYLRSATPARRKDLMKSRQGFITREGDLYLPQLAIALQANPPSESLRPRGFSPSQQQAFLYCLYGREPLTQEGLREATGMSAAGASRALSSLADMGLVDYTAGGRTGRKRYYFVPDKKEFFRRGRELFGDPVKRILTVSASPLTTASPSSGLSALAMRSDLVAPKRRTVAAGSASAGDLGKSGDDGEEKIDVQVLRYDPLPFSLAGMVDPFTMLATVGEKDERISMALRKALEDCEWYED
ncbi:helix-turn-helix domain-containing protein [Gordonibacter sp. 28C]|uniref:MarR family transcriptional regulator n=1 Tax=Gordonibacter sp. 28C TaxID=2078569 RepID=UPI0011C08355|nr:helix-turn-helix domain-containing protein [Gordonibacter sp. 28C]